MRSFLELMLIVLGLAGGAYLAARWNAPAPAPEPVAETSPALELLATTKPDARQPAMPADQGRFGGDWSPKAEPEATAEQPTSEAAPQPIAPPAEPQLPEDRNVADIEPAAAPKPEPAGKAAGPVSPPKTPMPAAAGTAATVVASATPPASAARKPPNTPAASAVPATAKPIAVPASPPATQPAEPVEASDVARADDEPLVDLTAPVPAWTPSVAGDASDDAASDEPAAVTAAQADAPAKSSNTAPAATAVKAPDTERPKAATSAASVSEVAVPAVLLVSAGTLSTDMPMQAFAADEGESAGGTAAVKAPAGTAKPAAKEAGTAPAADAKPAAPYQIVRAQFSTSIAGNEPIDRVEKLSDPSDKAVFFTEMDNQKAGTVVHRWSYQGETRAEIRLRVQKGRYRTWSVRSFSSADDGVWTVTVLDPEGHTLTTRRLTYKP